MPEQFMNKTMTFEYGGDAYREGHERTFGKKKCSVCGHPLEFHSDDKTTVTVEGLGTIPCWPPEEKKP